MNLKILKAVLNYKFSMEKESSSFTYDYEDVKNKTKISSVRGDSKGAGIKLDAPLLLAGFQDPGLIGSMSMSYIIEQLHMHQIAFVDSDFLMPSAVYVGNKLRHPFRLYAEKTGHICCLVCEAPIIATGIHAVSDTIVRWTVGNKFKEIILVGGFVTGFEGNVIDSDRKPLILSGDGSTDDNSYLEHVSQTEGPSGLALIVGAPGGLISACLSSGMPCKVLLIPTISGIADPEGVSILIEWLNKNLDSSFNVGVAPLKEKAKEIQLQLHGLIKSLQNAHRGEEVEKGRMYR